MDKVKDFLSQFNNKNILLGLSAGVDSMVLLDTIIKVKDDLNLSIEVAHIDHKTRGGESKKDAGFVKNKCLNYGVNFNLKSESMEDYARDHKISEEEAGRLLRHSYFEEVISDKDDDWYLCLAHNLDDQVETILMRIIRGTGPDGLAGMSKLDGNIIRPFLDIEKAEILSYAKDNSIDFRQDESNFENIYLRNKIRNQLLPILKNDYNPNIYEALVGLSFLTREQNSYVEEKIKDEIEDLIVYRSSYKTVFDKEGLKTRSNFEIKEFLRHEIDRIHSTYNFTKNHYDEIIKIIETSKSAITQINNLVFYNSFNKFFIQKAKYNQLPVEVNLGPNEIFNEELNGYGIKIKNLFDKDLNLLIRSRKNGDRIEYSNSIKKLKDFLIDKKIDTYQRDYLPIIEFNGKIIQVGTIFSKKNKNIDIDIRSKNEL